MVERIMYIVDFSEAVAAFQRTMAREDLPTIDLDVVKWQVLAIFEQVEPLELLERLATDLVQHDWLFSKEDYFETTPRQAKRAAQELRNYLRRAIIQLGHDYYKKFQEVGMLRTGTERYKITSRPLTNDTYIFHRTRP